MDNFLRLIQSLGHLILFVILQSICFYSMIRYNRAYRDIFTHTLSLYTAGISSQIYRVNNWLNAGTEADSLAEQNMQLLSKLPGVYYFEPIYRDSGASFIDTSEILPDTVHARDIIQKFTYLGARVVSNHIAGLDNFFIIDRGARAGVKPGQGVVNGRGVVGIVRRVSSNYSLVMSVLNRKTALSARLRRNQYFGSATWNGADARYMLLESIPKYADIVPGDTVETSGYSFVFPAELPIGIVDSVWLPPGSNFFNASVRIFPDMARLRNVYVINNIHRNELEYLQNQQ